MVATCLVYLVVAKFALEKTWKGAMIGAGKFLIPACLFLGANVTKLFGGTGGAIFPAVVAAVLIVWMVPYYLFHQVPAYAIETQD